MKLPRTAFAFLYYFVRQQWLKFAVLILASVAWSANEAFFPYFLKRIVNTLQSYQSAPKEIYHALSGTLLLLVLFWLIAELFMRLQGIVSIYTFPTMRANIRAKVFAYVKQHSHEYFSGRFAGNIAKKIADLPTSTQTLLEIILFQFITAATGIMIIFVMMWLTKPIFAGILLFWLCLHLGLTFLILRYGNYVWEMHADSVSTMGGKIVDVLTNILNVRLFARAQFETEYLAKFQQDEIVKAKKAMWVTELTRIGLGISGLMLIFGMIFTLLYGWIHQWVTLGDFTQVGMQTFWVLGWVWYVSYQIALFAREAGTISDALSLVRQSHDIVDAKNAIKLVVPSGQIRFESVSFEYHKNRPVFSCLNVTIAAGQKVGLVGFSGSGKSTFVNLILRFYDVKSGRILIDGQDIAQVTQDSLRQQIAMIPQDPSLFHRSLLENIRYGRLDATDAEVMRAAKLAHCDEFIEKLDAGYDSLVGERGIKLSGGQRQRIAIARAILKNAPILILDEATSSLDSVTEKLIQESLQQIMQDKTTIVIAHRLSTLANMDRILVFDKGKIVEDGARVELLQANQHFTQLWNMQVDGFLPDTASE